LRYNSAATRDAAAGVAVEVGSPDHKASGLIAVNVTAPPKVFANFRRLIISRVRPGLTSCSHEEIPLRNTGKQENIFNNISEHSCVLAFL
jgi:hypothetical protein